MNMKTAQEGLTIESSVGNNFTGMIYKGIMSDNVISRGQVLCAVASEARMSGSRLSVMSTAGSGNHEIRVFFTIFAVAEKRNLSREKLIKSLVLSNLITFTGQLYWILC